MLNKVDKIMPYAFPVIVILLGVVYYFVNPSANGHPIQCPWRLRTGTLCPACGSQRALNALVHGNVLQALSYIPYALIAVLISWYNRSHRFDGLKRIAFHPITLKAYVVLFFVWWIGRNLLGI